MSPDGPARGPPDAVEFSTLFFYFAGGLAVASAFVVVTARNPVASALFLLVTLGSIAALFVLLGAQFIAVLQVMVYIGAILVLFLFVIMLLNLGHAYRPDLRRPPWRLLALGVGFALFVELVIALAPVRAWPGPGPEALEVLQRSRGVVGSVAQLLFSDYVVPFEVTSILLLVAIVGALVLAKRRVD